MAFRLAVAGLVIPLAWIGSKLAGVLCIFTGMAVGQMISGVVALVWFGRVLKKKRAVATSSV